jgi:uncharacterized protein YndB with AHSA1/START domain
MNRLVALLVSSSLIIAGSAAGEMSEISTVRLSAEIQTDASPDVVWKALTTGSSLVTWCPYWTSPANGEAQLDAVGDVLVFTDEWGNGGQSVVTFLDPGRELRVAHEPTDGSYMCQAKLMLTPGEHGTAITYIEQYTDESSAEDREATAQSMQAQMVETLKALKKNAES